MELPRGTVLLDQHFGTTVVNTTDFTNAEVYEALSSQDRALVGALGAWAQATTPSSLTAQVEGMPLGQGGSARGRNGGLFQRDRYLTPARVFDQMRVAYEALERDDIVSSVADTTEALAFSAVGFFAVDEDEEDVYNQIAANIELDARLREMWRELFTVSQFYVAVWSERQTFKVRGTTKSGNQRRKTIDCVAPVGMSLLDPLKIAPVGSPLFGKERLAYIATREEGERFNEILQGADPLRDPIVSRLITGTYEPDRVEAAELSRAGVDPRHLFLLNPSNVFRHSLTRPSYQRWATPRMCSVLELLDMKHQLRQKDRAHLLGATHFIVLVTKGTDQLPAQAQEIANLQAQVRTVAQVPILVGDHRLHVDIVTPKLDNTLRPEGWNLLDARLAARLYGMFMVGNSTAGTGADDSVKLVKVIARGMESRRHMIRRALEKHVFVPLYEANDQLTTVPKLQFHPRAIALDFDAAWASFLFDLRTNNEISRETILSQFDLDQHLEAELRKREREQYDDIFQTQVPFSTPNPALPSPAGPAAPPGRDNGGGRRNGGGAAPGSGQGQPPRRPAKTSDPGRPAAAGLTTSGSADDDTRAATGEDDDA